MFAAVICATIANATSASTILGVDAVKKTMNSIVRESALLRYRAAATPRPNETTLAIASAAKPRTNVLKKREPRIELTGTRKYIDSPISPTTAPLSHVKYLTGSG